MFAKQKSPQRLYNENASKWVRTEPISLSDFTARPAILELCEPVTGLRILDLGCGEGYCSRELQRQGALAVHGIDVSQGMIEAARSQELQAPQGIDYQVGCATNLEQFGDSEIDLVVAVFLFNYLTIDQMQRCMNEVARILTPGGQFIFSVPHPAFPYMRKPEYPFYFQVERNHYFSSRDSRFEGRIWKRDGSWLEVQLIHKTVQDYFEALQSAGFYKMPTIRELRVLPEHVELDESFFGPLVDFPLHLAIKVSP
jgi:ubiquinone/menaquinone biosynthesis C-methylase UbiE